MPFLTTHRFTEFGTDSKGNARLQITDLFPNKSQANPTQTPNFQGPYNFRPVDTQSADALVTLPVLDASLDITASVSGLAAYFIAVVEDDANTTHISPAEAKAIGTAVIDRMKVGSSLTLSDINTIIVAEVGAGSELTNAGGSLSTGSVKEVLEILCGAKTFTLPVGHSVGDDGNANAFTAFADADAQAAAFTAVAGYTSIPANHKSFYISARQGQVATAQNSKTKTTNQPVLVAYDDDGSVIK